MCLDAYNSFSYNPFVYNPFAYNLVAPNDIYPSSGVHDARLIFFIKRATFFSLQCDLAGKRLLRISFASDTNEEGVKGVIKLIFSCNDWAKAMFLHQIARMYTVHVIMARAMTAKVVQDPWMPGQLTLSPPQLTSPVLPPKPSIAPISRRPLPSLSKKKYFSSKLFASSN